MKFRYESRGRGPEIFLRLFLEAACPLILTVPVHFLAGMMPARTLSRVVLPLPVRGGMRREERGGRNVEERRTRRPHDSEHVASINCAAQLVENGKVLL